MKEKSPLEGGDFWVIMALLEQLLLSISLFLATLFRKKPHLQLCRAKFHFLFMHFFFLIKGPEFEDVQFMVMENKRKLI